MIGTLIGLINMLKTSSDVSTVGPNMSVALLQHCMVPLLRTGFARQRRQS
ncbi:MAG: hypothetical protein V8S31_02765 [Lachnospiraceae bacterium]